MWPEHINWWLFFPALWNTSCQSIKAPWASHLTTCISNPCTVNKTVLTRSLIRKYSLVKDWLAGWTCHSIIHFQMLLKCRHLHISMQNPNWMSHSLDGIQLSLWPISWWPVLYWQLSFYHWTAFYCSLPSLSGHSQQKSPFPNYAPKYLPLQLEMCSHVLFSLAKSQLSNITTIYWQIRRPY